MRKAIASFLAVSMVLLLIVSLSYGQRRTGSIRGTVKDSEGQGVVRVPL